jgi:hypothetical protein
MTKVYYTGIGANESGLHTIDEFLKIMDREFTQKKWEEDTVYILFGREQHHQLQFKDWNLPEDFTHFTLTDWLEYVGADLIT